MKNDANICLNCAYQLEGQLYCPQCGNKSNIKNLSLNFLLSTLFTAFVDFDKKMLRSLRDIWIPNKISIDFLSGGRSTYVNHFRFYILSLGLFFTLLTLSLKKADLNFEKQIHESGIKSDLHKRFEKIAKEEAFICNSHALNAIRTKVFFIQEYSEKEKEGSLEIQSISKDSSDLGASPEREPNKEIQVTTEDVQLEWDSEEGIASQEALMQDGTININDAEYNIYDVFLLEQDSIFNKYNINTPRKEFYAKRIIKTIKNGGSAVLFFVGNLFWGFLLATFLMAALLSLLYYRSHSFFIEHLMHSINFHTICLLVGSIGFILNYFCNSQFYTNPGVLFMATILCSGLHLTVSLKLYHKQGWLKTLLKSSVIIAGYIMIWSLVILTILWLSFLAF